MDTTTKQIEEYYLDEPYSQLVIGRNYKHITPRHIFKQIEKYNIKSVFFINQ